MQAEKCLLITKTRIKETLESTTLRHQYVNFTRLLLENYRESELTSERMWSIAILTTLLPTLFRQLI